MFENPKDKILLKFSLKPTNYMQQAKNSLMIDCFIFDIDCQVAKNVYLLRYQMSNLPLSTSPFEDQKNCMYVNYKQFSKL